MVSVMNDSINYLMWGFTQLVALAAACFLFGLDRRQVKREREQGQHTRWFQRGFFVAGWIFGVPLLGVQLPQLIISLFVFHDSVFPSSFDFNYRLFQHSLSFFIWISVFSYGLSVLLIVYVIFLGIRGAGYQREQQKKQNRIQ
jgi:hypothetical protein